MSAESLMRPGFRHSLIEAAEHSCGWPTGSVSALLTFSPGGPIGP